VNAMDLWQFTPLHEAASKNRVEVCSLLLSYGADPTLLNCHNKSTIDLAPTPQLKERLACEYKVKISSAVIDCNVCLGSLDRDSSLDTCQKSDLENAYTFQAIVQCWTVDFAVYDLRLLNFLNVGI